MSAVITAAVLLKKIATIVMMTTTVEETEGTLPACKQSASVHMLPARHWLEQ